jgi:hypothetical protein
MKVSYFRDIYPLLPGLIDSARGDCYNQNNEIALILDFSDQPVQREKTACPDRGFSRL